MRIGALTANAESVWTKGGFDTRALVDHVVGVLEHTVESGQAVDQLSPRENPVTPLADESARQSIVIIDDNPVDARLARRVLESEGAYRVIEATTQSDLPPGLQTAEFLMDHGLIDAIVPRKELKDRLSYYLDFMMTRAAAKAA